MNKFKSIKDNKILNIIWKILNGVLVVLVVSFVLTVYMQRFSGNKLSFFNYRMFTVITGSMEPKYKIGDVLLSKEVKPEEIKVGDAITYEGVSGAVAKKVITHEVISINTNTQGKYLFKAKGLNNLIEDPTIYEEQVLGIVTYKVKTLSFVYKIISTQIGFYLCIIIPLVVVIGYEIALTMVNIKVKNKFSN